MPVYIVNESAEVIEPLHDVIIITLNPCVRGVRVSNYRCRQLVIAADTMRHPPLAIVQYEAANHWMHIAHTT